MQNKELSQFYNEIIVDMSKNPSWLKDLESPDDFETLFAKLSQLGTEKGYNFSEQELRNALDSGITLQEQELSDELLVGVAGGKDDGSTDEQLVDDFDTNSHSYNHSISSGE